jgi:mono/diheme cytochrome c family protein
LYPAFPYPNYTQISREDSDALFAYLQSLTPVSQRNPSHRLTFPYNTQTALVVWRALFFRPAGFEHQPAKDPVWNRGAYLVRGLGHCAACHAQRNLLGATTNALALRGGMIPAQHWYAPSLASAQEAGVADGNTQEMVDLLKKGISTRGAAMGPMAEVVFRSTQYLLEVDLQAIAVYLNDLPAPKPEPTPENVPDSAMFSSGEKIYARHCAECHGEKGEGAPGAYPALAGNRVVSMTTPVNLVQIVLHGGYPPATNGNSRPYGMPPFRQTIDDEEVAAVLTYIRRAWGHAARPVSVLDVTQNQ